MGKGDKKTRRGKLFQGSYGVRRRRKSGRKASVEAVVTVKPKESVEIPEIKEVKPPKEVKQVKVAKETKATKESTTTKIPKEKTGAKKVSKPKKQADSASKS